MWHALCFCLIGSQYKEICWKLDQRGGVGETPLHVCLLMATSIHADLYKRILKIYPKLICDIYTSDEFYGSYFRILGRKLCIKLAKFSTSQALIALQEKQTKTGKSRMNVITQFALPKILQYVINIFSLSYNSEKGDTIRYVSKPSDWIEICNVSGENMLHMAIVNEDPAMLKFILDHGVDHGADYHQRACGNFFTADDQKATRRDSLEHEWFDMNVNSNYDGWVILA